MYELLSEQIVNALKNEPKSLDDLCEIFPKHKRNSITGELYILKRKNIIIKSDKVFQLHPSYKRQNNL